MRVVLISYDLIGRDETSDDYKRLIEKIKSYGGWAKIHYSFWALQTSLSTKQLRDELAAYVDKNDRLIVIEAGRNAAWRNLANDVSDWLKNSL